MGPTPVYGARAEKPPKNADFAMKQTNICRLSGDIINDSASHLHWITCCEVAQLNIQISHGSAAKIEDEIVGFYSFFRSSSKNATMKEWLKLVHICESYEA